MTMFVGAVFRVLYILSNVESVAMLNKKITVE